MDNDAEARMGVEEALLRFAFHRHVSRLNIGAALAAVHAEMGLDAEMMIARSSPVGHIPGVHIGDEFIYRAEMHLVGLHDDLVRGISLGMHIGGLEVATCAVAVFERHDIFLDEDLVIYGGEGGRLREASRLSLRVLADQHWTRRNRAMFNSMYVGAPVRFLVRSLMDDNTFRYCYLGLYTPFDWRIIRSNGFRVYEFFLERI